MPSFPSPLMIPRDLDPRVVRILQRINEHLRELSQGAKATSEGLVASGGSTNLGSTLTQVGTPTGGGTVQTASASLASPTYAIAGGLSFTDTADVTKRVLFNAASLTTGTTRTLTVPDLSGTLVLSTSVDPFPGYLLLAGRGTGQVIGAGTYTGGTATSLVVEGAILCGDNLGGAFSPGRAFNISHQLTNGSILCSVTGDLSNLSGTASGTLTGLSITLSGATGYTAGSYAVRGFILTGTVSIASGTTATLVEGGRVQASIASTSGTLTAMAGLTAIVAGPPIGSGTTTTMTGLDIQLNNKGQNVTTVRGLYINRNAGTLNGTIGTANAIEVQSIWSAAAGTTLWQGLVIPLPAGPATIRGLVIGNMPNQLAGRLRIGSAADPTHLLELAAGTTTVAPLLLTSGTSLTSPVAGAIEFTTDDFFATITTGPARKAFVLDDGTRLTATRIPFATTNGRLTDHANVTFAAGTGLTLAETLLLTGGSATVAPLKISAGTILTTPVSGVVENDGVDFLVTDATGDRNRLAPRLLARRTAINLANANTGWTVYTVPTGRTLVVTGVIVRLTAFTASGANFRVDGTAAPGDISPAVAEAFTANGQYMSLAITNPATVQPATTAISFFVAATTATATATVELFGYLY